MKLIRDQRPCDKNLYVVFQSAIISRLSSPLLAYERLLQSEQISHVNAYCIRSVR